MNLFLSSPLDGIQNEDKIFLIEQKTTDNLHNNIITLSYYLPGQYSENPISRDTLKTRVTNLIPPKVAVWSPFYYFSDDWRTGSEEVLEEICRDLFTYTWCDRKNTTRNKYTIDDFYDSIDSSDIGITYINSHGISGTEQVGDLSHLTMEHYIDANSADDRHTKLNQDFGLDDDSEYYFVKWDNDQEGGISISVTSRWIEELCVVRPNSLVFLASCEGHDDRNSTIYTLAEAFTDSHPYAMAVAFGYNDPYDFSYDPKLENDTKAIFDTMAKRKSIHGVKLFYELEMALLFGGVNEDRTIPKPDWPILLKWKFNDWYYMNEPVPDFLRMDVIRFNN